jgi:hypothetical protein
VTLAEHEVVSSGQMRVLDAGEFESTRRSGLRSFGRVSSRTAKGFIIELGQPLESAGLGETTVKWRGGDDGLFTVTGRFDGEPGGWTALVLAVAESCPGHGRSPTTASRSTGSPKQGSLQENGSRTRSTE